MNNRIVQFMEAEQLSPSKLADILGVQRSSLSHIVSGRNNPSYDFIAKILKHFSQLNPDWLILGKGQMYRESYSPSLFPQMQTDNPPKSKVNYVEKMMGEEIPASVAPPMMTSSPLPKSTALQVDKAIERIIIFYTDNTFDIYHPSSK